jgi:hypothetical protein
MADVNRAYINNLYYEPGTGGVGVITLTISYRDTEAQATILVPQPTDYSIRDQIFYTETQRCVRNVRHIAAFRARPDSVCVRDRLSLGAAGFEPLHVGIGIRQDSQPRAGLELAHLEL